MKCQICRQKKICLDFSISKKTKSDQKLTKNNQKKNKIESTAKKIINKINEAGAPFDACHF